MPFKTINRFFFSFKNFERSSKRLFYFTAATTIGVSYYMNVTYFRKLKGIRKLRARFKGSTAVDSQIILGSYGYFTVFEKHHKSPIALVFPKTLPEVQRMVYLCNKYRISITLTDKEKIEEIPFHEYDQPYIACNLRQIKNIEFDEAHEIFRAGVGTTLKELNDYASQFGYYLPVKNEEVFSHKQLSEVINEDTLEYHHKYYYSIRNFLHNMLIVMPDSTAVKTSSDVYKSSLGLNLNDLFVGQQGFFGIATDLSLKLTKKAAQKYLYKINLEAEQNQGHILNLIQQMKALYSHDINSIEMRVSSKGSQILIDSNQTIQSMLEHEDVQLNENLEEYTPNQPSKERNRKIFLRVPANQVGEMYFGLQELLTNDLNIRNFLMKIELFKGDLIIEFKPQEHNVEIVEKQIINYVTNRDGMLVSHSDHAAQLKYKKESIFTELGRNNLLFQTGLKKWMDPKNVFVCDNAIWLENTTTKTLI